MLHRLGSMFFLLAIITGFYRYFKFINPKIGFKSHIITGIIGAGSMILYSITDFFKDGEATILLMGFMSIMIIISGLKEVRKKYKWLHLVSVVGFAMALIFHIKH